jgi:hypothetical protein
VASGHRLVHWLVVVPFVAIGVWIATHPKKYVELSRRYSALRRPPDLIDESIIRVIGVALLLLALFIIGLMLSAR